MSRLVYGSVRAETSEELTENYKKKHPITKRILLVSQPDAFFVYRYLADHSVWNVPSLSMRS